MTDIPPKKKSKAKGCLKLLLIGFAVLFILGVIGAIFSPQPSEDGNNIADVTPSQKDGGAPSIEDTEKKSEPTTAVANKPKVSKQPLSDITWSELNDIYSTRAKTSKLQKEAKWKKYKGEKVQWSGKVGEIGESFGSLTMQVHMQGGIMADVILTLYPNQKDKALELSKGDKVEFIGILNRWGSLLPLSLKDGVIVDW